MQDDVFTLTPHIIERWHVADKIEMASVPGPEAGEQSLLVFASEGAAEAFRTETGKFPASEGFDVVYVDVDGLRTMIGTWGFRNLAVVGLGPSEGGAEIGGADAFDAEGFCEMLEEGAE